MNDNYLWDKTGSDAEIESLENTLSAFRLQNTIAPQIPAKTVAFPKQSQRRQTRFQFALAAAACLTIAIAAFGVWIQISNNKTDVETAPTQTASVSRSVETVQTDSSNGENGSVSTVKPEIQKQTASHRAVKTDKFAQPIALRKESKTRAIKTKKPAVQLTKEEQFAYDQLMLALSITSSKLKVVKDAVEGGDE